MEDEREPTRLVLVDTAIRRFQVEIPRLARVETVELKEPTDEMRLRIKNNGATLAEFSRVLYWNDTEKIRVRVKRREEKLVRQGSTQAEWIDYND